MARSKSRLVTTSVALVFGSMLVANLASAAEFYRYKRVNGEWIEGQFRFRARSAQPDKSALREPARRSIRRPTRSARHDERPLPPSLATTPLKPPVAALAGQADLALRDPDSARDLSQLKAALEKRAAERAAQITAERQSGMSARSARGADPVSVSLDFRSGLKTTRFANGELSAEAFDAPSLRMLAASPPLSISRD